MDEFSEPSAHDAVRKALFYWVGTGVATALAAVGIGHLFWISLEGLLAG